MFGNHGLCGLLEEGAHEKSPKCLGRNLGDFGGFCKGLHTFLFEITDAKDVHIIREELGETLIDCIDVATGRQFTEAELEEIGKQYGVRRPEMLKNITFGELKGRLKNVEHEGFMVFDAQNGEMLFKLKSPYYLISKFLGRSNEGNIGRKLDKRHVE